MFDADMTVSSNIMLITILQALTIPFVIEVKQAPALKKCSFYFLLLFEQYLLFKHLQIETVYTELLVKKRSLYLPFLKLMTALFVIVSVVSCFEALNKYAYLHSQ